MDTKVASQVEGVKVFSATKMVERLELGEAVTRWMQTNPNLEPLDIVVTQSSDSEFHCIAITVFYRTKPATNGKRARSTELPTPTPIVKERA